MKSKKTKNKDLPPIRFFTCPLEDQIKNHPTAKLYPLYMDLWTLLYNETIIELQAKGYDSTNLYAYVPRLYKRILTRIKSYQIPVYI